MTIKTLEELFIQNLSVIYSVEKQIIKALPQMAKAATHKKLTTAFDQHLEETKEQVKRLEKLVDITENVKIKRLKSKVIEALINEAEETINSVEKGNILDAGLISAAQQVEHYEIAIYSTLYILATKLGYKDAAKLLAKTLKEEKNTDEKLTIIAEQKLLT